MQQAAVEAVARGARAAGVDFSALLETARRESGLDKNARAVTSSAVGLFQFIESTWLNMVQKHGPKYGIGVGDIADKGERRRLLDLRYDPEIAAGMAGELTRENEATLTGKLGRAPSASELYAAHVLGPEGAAALIRAPAGASAAALLPKAAGANRTIFFGEGGAALSAQTVLAKLSINPASQPAPVVSARPASSNNFADMLSLTGLAEALGDDLWALAMRAYRGDGR